MNLINNDWDIVLKEVFESKEFNNLYNKVKNEYKNKICYPSFDNIFNSLKLTSYKNVKAVILGQDPYHGENEANGLCFSVSKDVKIPPSLKNIFKELNSDLGYDNPLTGDLTSWAKEGVLLLNTILTVEKDKPLSHKDFSWQIFTNEVIKAINNKNTPVVFILWGSIAQAKKELITNNNHLIIESSHPSPFSARKSFFGSKPFSKTNQFLIKNNQKGINFKL